MNVIKVKLNNYKLALSVTAQKIKFFIKDFFNKCDRIRSFLPIFLYLLKKSLMKNLQCAVCHAK